MPRIRRAAGIVLATAAAALLSGCSIEKAELTPTEEAQQRQNLREVRGSASQFATDVGDPEGRGQIPRGR